MNTIERYLLIYNNLIATLELLKGANPNITFDYNLTDIFIYKINKQAEISIIFTNDYIQIINKQNTVLNKNINYSNFNAEQKIIKIIAKWI